MLNETQLKFVCYCQFSIILGVVQICKSGKEHLNAQIYMFYAFTVHIFETFDISHAFLTIISYQH